MTLKSPYFPLVWATSLTLACANTAPTVVIQSAGRADPARSAHLSARMGGAVAG